MKKPKAKKFYLLSGLAFNIGLLGYFKYMDFFIINFNWGFGTDMPLLHLALPLAISFYTLQQIAYLVDSYGGLVKEKNFLDYTLFVTFFPQLIAGPIVHHKEMMPQFSSLKTKAVDYKNIATGLFIFSIGLFKKVVIADTFAQWASAGHANTEVLNLLEAWATSLSYTFQLYFDFSGYTDMAIGAALLFNIKLPQNFNSPYKTTGLIEFWQRWHMTLTRFITTYIYKPFLKSLGKISFEKAMVATVFTMFIAGLWHGAAWTFVIFGLLHGLAIVINHYWKKSKIKMPHWLAWFITFNFLNLSFVIFRAKDWADAINILKAMISIDTIVLPQEFANKLSFLNTYGIEFGIYTLKNTYMKEQLIVWTITLVLMVFPLKNSSELLKKMPDYYLYFTPIMIIVSIYYGFVMNSAEFIYFNF